MCRKMFSFHGQFGWPPRDDGLLIPSNSEVLLPLLPFSSSVAMQSSNTAQNQCGLLIVDDVWNRNPGWQWDGTMSWIKAKASCMYFERSRVPFLKVGYLLLVEILTSLAKKKKVQGENEHQCVNSPWMHLVATVSLPAMWAVQRLKVFLLSIRLKGWSSVHTFLTNIGYVLRGQHNMKEAFMT